MTTNEISGWRLAELAAAVCAVAPQSIGGVLIRACPGPVRDHWLETMERFVAGFQSIRRVPVTTSEDRLVGGLDLAATLHKGSIVTQPGILAESDQGLILLKMAERAAPYAVSRIAATLDSQRISTHRDGVSISNAARIAVLALDEGIGPEEHVSPVLADRLGIWVDLTAIDIHQIADSATSSDQITRARDLLPDVAMTAQNLNCLGVVAASFGVVSVRALLFAERIARIIAALNGRTEVTQSDLTASTQLVLGARAIILPDMDTERDEQPPPESDEAAPDGDEDSASGEDEQAAPAADDSPMEELLLSAVMANLPPDLLNELRSADATRKARGAGKAGAMSHGKSRGRPVGNSPGTPGSGDRLDLLATLRAAAPWQQLRRREVDLAGHAGARRSGLIISRDDLRIVRYQQRTETTTIFVVDASGSAALHRLAEAKGAVECLLTECYIRRDDVALIAFRGTSAPLLLPPTRSLVRAKRTLVGLPGGGGTPIATAIDSALQLAEQVRRNGVTPGVVFLTDGKANVARDGSQGRSVARADALDSARRFAAAGVRGLVVDTSPRPNEQARELADTLGGAYLPLPLSDAKGLSAAIQAGLH